MPAGNNKKESLREQVLSQEVFASERHEKYQKEVDKMLEKQSRTLKIEKWTTGPMWFYIVILCTAFLIIGGSSTDPAKKSWFGILACFWLIFGGVFLLRYFINRNRLDILKELKEIQLRMEEFKEQIAARQENSATPTKSDKEGT
jgi:hypothetical protein